MVTKTVVNIEAAGVLLVFGQSPCSGLARGVLLIAHSQLATGGLARQQGGSPSRRARHGREAAHSRFPGAPRRRFARVRGRARIRGLVSSNQTHESLEDLDDVVFCDRWTGVLDPQERDSIADTGLEGNITPATLCRRALSRIFDSRRSSRRS